LHQPARRDDPTFHRNRPGSRSSGPTRSARSTPRRPPPRFAPWIAGRCTNRLLQVDQAPDSRPVSSCEPIFAAASDHRPDPTRSISASPLLAVASDPPPDLHRGETGRSWTTPETGGPPSPPVSALRPGRGSGLSRIRRALFSGSRLTARRFVAGWLVEKDWSLFDLTPCPSCNRTTSAFPVSRSR
jgi:hypothetical protein